MDVRRQELCELMTQNRRVTRAVMRYQDAEFSSLCAVVATAARKALDEDEVLYVENLIKKSKFLGSEFLPGSRMILATTLEMIPDEETMINRVINIDKMLLKEMLPSHHLSITAMMIARSNPDESKDAEIVRGVGEQYKVLRERYPFLISDNDCNAAAMAVLDHRDVDVFGERMDSALTALRPHALSKKVLIPLAQLFALSRLPLDEKVERFQNMLDMLEDSNIPVGTEDYDFAAIGALALASHDLKRAQQNVKEIHAYIQENQTLGRFARAIRNRRVSLYAIFLELAALFEETEEQTEKEKIKKFRIYAVTAALVNDVTRYLGGMY